MILTDEQKAEAVRILTVNNCGEPVGYKKIHSDAGLLHLLTGYLLIGTDGYAEVNTALDVTAVGTLHSLTGVTGHGVPHQLNIRTLDVDSEVTGFGTHNRLVVFGEPDGSAVTIREDVDADPSLPLSTEWQRQSVAHHPSHRLHPAGTDLVHVSSDAYDGALGRCIEHTYSVVRHKPIRTLTDPAKEA